MSRPAWQSRLEDCIVEVMAVGYQPTFWITSYDATDNTMSKEPIIIQASKGADEAFFVYMPQREGRPFNTLMEAKARAKMPLVAVQPINETYRRSVEGCVRDLLARQKNIESQRQEAQEAFDWMDHYF